MKSPNKKGLILIKVTPEVLTQALTSNGLAYELLKGLPVDAKFVGMDVVVEGPNSEVSAHYDYMTSGRHVSLIGISREISLYFETDYVNPGLVQTLQPVITTHQINELF